eukprot:1033517-Ditylum_brightwellii.AAC.1
MEQSEFVVVTNGSVGEIDMSFRWKHSAFSHCAMEYTALTKPLKGQLYLDNKGVITQIQQQQSYPQDYSFNALILDWDVIAQISNILGIGNFTPKIRHIQGHQDKHKKYNDLSLPAKLNVNADWLAVEYQSLNKKTTRK